MKLFLSYKNFVLEEVSYLLLKQLTSSLTLKLFTVLLSQYVLLLRIFLIFFTPYFPFLYSNHHLPNNSMFKNQNKIHLTYRNTL